MFQGELEWWDWGSFGKAKSLLLVLYTIFNNVFVPTGVGEEAERNLYWKWKKTIGTRILEMQTVKNSI